MKRGYIQVYTGNGKGKTTAALGLAVRAAGAGLKIFIGQFLKGMEYSELLSLQRLSDNIEITQLGGACFVFGKPSAGDIRMAQDGLGVIKEKILSAKYDMIIMDEVNVAVSLGLLSAESVIDVLRLKPENMEIIMTGRGAPDKFIELADLVTEMKEIKHYYQSGVQARVGIEK